MPACPGPISDPLSSRPALRFANSDDDPVPASRAEPDRPLGHVPAPVMVLDQQSFNPDVPNVARVYDALLGGKDNFEADRRAAAKLLKAVPRAAVAARDNRAFLCRTVRYLAREAGVSQFLDVGTGLPTGGSVHEVARACDVRRLRVVYADYDAVVVRHAEALLADSPNVAVVRADLRNPRDLLADPTVRTTVDLADSEDPWAIVNQLKDRMAPGSYLVITHVTADHITPQAACQARGAYQDASAPGVPRSRAQIARFFGGLDMVSPGLVNVPGWRPDAIGPAPGPALFYAGVGRKTSPGRPR
jgi:S-adenosyl methyltransferase